jgi:hypothetical protein
VPIQLQGRPPAADFRLRPHVSTRWLHELAIPGRPDISSVYASYAFAGVAAVGVLPVVHAEDPSGCIRAATVDRHRASENRYVVAVERRPPKMFSHAEPFEEIGVVMVLYLYQIAGAI